MLRVAYFKIGDLTQSRISSHLDKVLNLGRKYCNQDNNIDKNKNID